MKDSPPLWREIFTARIGRGAYVAWGLGLVLLKWNVDRLLSWQMGQGRFMPWNYFLPAGALTVLQLNPEQRDFFLALALTAAPFAVAGILLTSSRLRAAGWPGWLVFLFFLPVINLLLFAMLAVTPSREAGAAGERDLYSQMRRLLPHSPWAAALVAVLLTSSGTALLTALGTRHMASYGWALFFGLPFASGWLAVLLASARRPLSCGQSVTTALLTVLVSGALLIGFAVEGLVCLVMALPLGATMAVLGGMTAYFMQSRGWRGRERHAAMCAAALVMPLVILSEKPLDVPQRRVTSEVRIAAPPAQVWPRVIAFSRIPEPTQWIFRTGIAYPIEAVIDGRGVGALRRCRFSTGDFLEPITAWEPPRRLAFRVQAQPAALREISPFHDLHPAHLEGYLVSERGEFELVPQRDGSTLLRGSTWYRQRLWPQQYWGVFSDHLIHAIHLRVLEHIRNEVETADRIAD